MYVCICIYINFFKVEGIQQCMYIMYVCVYTCMYVNLNLKLKGYTTMQIEPVGSSVDTKVNNENKRNKGNKTTHRQKFS